MTLRTAIDQFIAWKRALGARCDSDASVLGRYVCSVGEDVGCDEVREEHARAFIDTGRPSYRASKHATLDRFYRYAVGRGLTMCSPLPAEAPKRPPAGPPYIYSRDELRRLLEATETYQKRTVQLEPHTFRTLLLLLYATGLRHGEALRLTLDDVDLANQLLTVRDTKFAKDRIVPFGAQLAPVLEAYAARRKASGASQLGGAPFLANRDGTPLVQVTVCGAFARLREAAGVRREDGVHNQPRLHDLRHGFAVDRLTAGYRRGENMQFLLPRLSTYLGHVSVASTQTYLTMTPELLREAALRFERYVACSAGGGHE